MNAIQKLSFKHEGLMNSLLANPHWSYAEHAAALGYTQSWVSQIVNSDMFQKELHERAKEAGVTLGVSIQEKMRATYGLALEDVQNRIVNGKASEKLLTDTMKALGATREFAPSTHIGPSYNWNLSAQEIADLRERAAQLKQGKTTTKAEVTVEIQESISEGTETPVRDMLLDASLA